jgi:ferredoxin
MSRPEIGKWGRGFPTQILSLIAFNGYFWRGGGKYLCLPVLNCYACPIGTVACPIGSLTAFALARRIPFYILGFLGLIGLAVGRAFCGWACPFGFFQDLLYRIRSFKFRLPRAANALKYALLVVLVLGLPLILAGGKRTGSEDRITGEGTGALDYCSLVCPAGTLEGGAPVLASSAEVRAQATWRTWSKIGIAAAILGLTVVARRSFCRALCPLGALMALSSRVSVTQLHTEDKLCTRCLRCVKVCPTYARHLPFDSAHGKPFKEFKTEATAECVLCLDCVRNCPEKGALAARFAGKTISVSEGKSRE